MGLICSGNTTLTPTSDDKALTGYLWPIVCEMIKTAIENNQNLVVEGCYIPFEWDKDFTAEYLRKTWDSIMKDENHHLIVCEEEGQIVASCVCVIIPNLTRGVRPYAFVENVVTHGEYRKKGYATACLDYAKKIAKEQGCYKMMLLTGSKEESTLQFYRNAGYNSADKTAFIQWL